MEEWNWEGKNQFKVSEVLIGNKLHTAEIQGNGGEKAGVFNPPAPWLSAPCPVCGQNVLQLLYRESQVFAVRSCWNVREQ
uniref:Macaca fascicularis brain cDNA clone: QmoA-12168, similar to human hypothetical protein LOC200895 (LOC200895), mRNA, RefSeq: NM_176815.2 n=1 Tax=Macaca fascicularis TaxID=9541 RepID=I7GNA6_MACFA|nr:unnamed protein product [Macaca fascicularis]